MTGARHFAKVNERKRAAGLRERRERDRLEILERAEQVVTENTRNLIGAPLRCIGCGGPTDFVHAGYCESCEAAL